MAAIALERWAYIQAIAAGCDVEALIIRIGFVDILYYIVYKKEPPKPGSNSYKALTLGLLVDGGPWFGIQTRQRDVSLRVRGLAR